MFTCTFSDEKKTSVKYLNAYEEPQYWDNANRRSLRFVCAADEISLDELDKLISVAANCKTLTLSSDGEPLETMAKGQELGCREKLLVRTQAPVPKPTQVGRKRILRCAGKPSLRNSAKCIRNFGKRIA